MKQITIRAVKGKSYTRVTQCEAHKVLWERLALNREQNNYWEMYNAGQCFYAYSTNENSTKKQEVAAAQAYTFEIVKKSKANYLRLT